MQNNIKQRLNTIMNLVILNEITEVFGEKMANCSSTDKFYVGLREINFIRLSTY